MENKQLIPKGLAAVLAAMLSLAQAQAQGPQATLEQQLLSQYNLTTPTADNTDIVTTGSVLILRTSGFVAGAVSNQVPTRNTYKEGKIKPEIPGIIRNCGFCRGIPHVPDLGPSRSFVSGEMVYVTRITVDRNKDGVVFDLISDAYGNAGRYKGSLTFQFPRASLGSANLTQVQSMIGEVFRIAPEGNQNAPDPGNSAPQPQQPGPITRSQADTPLAPIPDLAPLPPDQPAPTGQMTVIEVGQTRDQVVAILGQPDTVIKGAGTTEIYQYKQLKITFANGRMTDAQ